MLSERLRFADIRRTSAFRLSAALGSAFAIGIVVLLGAIYILTARELTARSDLILHDLANRVVAGGSATLPVRIRTEMSRADPALTYYGLISDSGKPLAGTLRLHGAPLFNLPTDIELGGGVPIRVLAVRGDHGEILLVGRDVSQIRDLRRNVLEILVGSGLAIVLGMAFAAVGLSIKPLRRVRDLEAASRAIASGHLDQRMPIAGKHDELDQFAATVNVMVEEVVHVIGQVKGVTDAIAHDLRTPLTRVRSTLYRLAQEGTGPIEDRTRVEAAVDDLDTVLERFAALLRITEFEAGSRRAAFASLDLGNLARQVAELYEPLAEDRGIALKANCETVEAEGDEKLLFEAVSNLVDNAIKFGREGGIVTISTGFGEGGWHLDVKDDGPGISPDEREAVLRRFHRGRGSEGIAGTGLGLSVVAAILGLHGFRLELRDAAPGLLARVISSS